MRIHSLLDPKCRVSRSELNGRGVFARESFAPGDLVAVWGGKIYTSQEVDDLANVMPHFHTHTITVCSGYYIGSENLYEFDDAELFNHSCDPNTGIRGQIILVARREIQAGEELTFDYDTTEIAMNPFECHCGSPYCRKKIDGSAWRNPEFVKRNRGFLSWYIMDLLQQEQMR